MLTQHTKDYLTYHFYGLIGYMAGKENVPKHWIIRRIQAEGTQYAVGSLIACAGSEYQQQRDYPLRVEIAAAVSKDREEAQEFIAALLHTALRFAPPA